MATFSILNSNRNGQTISTNCVAINKVHKENFGAAFLAAKDRAKCPINMGYLFDCKWCTMIGINYREAS